jgi:Ca-activated chloride channel family protein
MIAMLLGATVAASALLGDAAFGTASATLPDAASGASSNGVTFSGTVDKTAVMLHGDGEVRLELTMAAESGTGEVVRVPTDLVVVLDRSGSMDGRKMQVARAAVHQLLAELSPEDRFALVTYAADARLSVPLGHATAAAQSDWRHVVDDVTADGGTNMSSGLDMGLDIVDRARRGNHAPRVILVSDGHANQGDASFAGLRRRALRASRGEYVLSTIGVGDDFNEALMIALADAGTGNYYYLQNLTALAQIFEDEFDSARETVASGLSVRITPAPGVQVVDAAGYPLERYGPTTAFQPGALFAGQTRKVWVTLRVPTDEMRDVPIGDVRLTFTRDGSRRELALDSLPRIAAVRDEDRFFASVDEAAWGEAVAGDAYNELQWQVGRMVSDGQKEKALQAIQAYQAENRRLNSRIGSAAVSQSLVDSETLQAEVEAAFTGADQSLKQNKLGKTRSEAGYVGRRKGARRH